MADTRSTETDPSVCYRHPGRQSWVLCQRCGRTVCPECQILAPVGVHCPECVRETSGGVQWRPTNVAPLKPKRRRAPGRARTLLMARTAGGTPVLTYGLIGSNVLFFVVGIVTPVPFGLLAAYPGLEWQLWRFVTAALVPYPGLSFSGFLSLALGVLFLYLTGPQLERMLGLARYAAVVGVATIVGSAAALLSVNVNYGLTAPLFGGFAALLIVVWSDERARVQILIMLGLNLILTIVTGPSSLPTLVGALIGGAGTAYVLRTAGDRPWKRTTPALIIGGSTAALVVITVLKGVLAG